MPATATCPRCQKTFDVPPEHGGVWHTCPHCHEVNLEALVHKSVTVRWQTGLGVILFLAALLGGALGTFLFCLGVAFTGQDKKPLMQLLGLVWFSSSVAVLVNAVRLLKAGSKPESVGTLWGRSRVFLLMLILGLCGWIFVFGTCASVDNL